MPNLSHPAGLSDARLRFWLFADGSLTARLSAFGRVTVQVQQQGACPLWKPEQADLQMRGGYVREVVLLLDGSPAVWARSATTRRAVQGPWRALQGLGTRPLAELLFVGRQVRREPLRTWQLPRGGPEARHIRQQWQGFAQQTPVADQPRWARSSVFWQHGHALRVMEAFSPWVLGFGAPKGRAG